MWQSVDKRENCEYCQTSADIWDFLDGVYIICLKERVDRFENALKEMHRVGLCKRAVFYLAERSKDGFVAGCWDSHVQIAKHALELQQSNVMALEDDVEFDTARSILDITSQTRKALERLPQSKWTRLSLGHISWFRMHYAEGLDRSSSVLTHAQIWSIRGLEWMADNPYDKISKLFNMQVDSYISVHLKFAYSVKPMVAFQRNEQSDRKLVEPLLEEDNMKNTDIWIPIVWAVGVLLGFILLLLVTRLWLHLSWMWVGLWSMVLIVIPFFVVWMLIVTDMI